MFPSVVAWLGMESKAVMLSWCPGSGNSKKNHAASYIHRQTRSGKYPGDQDPWQSARSKNDDA